MVKEKRDSEILRVPEESSVVLINIEGGLGVTLTWVKVLALP